MPKRRYTGLERRFAHPRSAVARRKGVGKNLQKLLNSHTREAVAHHGHFGKHPIYSGFPKMPMLPRQLSGAPLRRTRRKRR
jgi:hypothetical protein